MLHISKSEQPTWDWQDRFGELKKAKIEIGKSLELNIGIQHSKYKSLICYWNVCPKIKDTKTSQQNGQKPHT